MSIDTEVRVPTQPRSFRGIIRAGELQVPTIGPDRASRARAVASDAARAAGRAGAAGLHRLGSAVWRRRVPLAIFLPAFAAYVAVGSLLTFKYATYNGDAQSRLANAFYVLYSRDPHMGAIGFVWNPLPSLSVMPLLLLKGIWPALAQRAFAGNLTSAFFMAGNVVLVHAILREFRVRRTPRLALTALFAVQPMIVVYGANGMSEAIFLFFLLLSCRRLARWLQSGRTWELALAGVSLAFAYLARNEAVMPAIVAAGLVTVVTALRARGALRIRVRAAIVNGFIFAAPPAFAFVIWAAISWIIVGHPLEQFSSQYGTASQLAVAGNGIVATRGGLSSIDFVALQLGGLAPALPLAMLAAAVTAVRRRDLRMLAPMAVLGGVVMFAVVAFLGGQTAGWLRYNIAVIPLTFLVTGAALARPESNRERWRWLRASLATTLALAVAIPSIATSTLAMADRRIGHEEHNLLGFIFNPSAPAGEYEFRYRHRTASRVSSYIDAMGLPRGSVVMDTFTPCIPIVALTSRRPQQFVITNDRDFKPVLADPVTFGAQYILVPHPGGLGDLDEINRTYPALFDTGAGLADLKHEFPIADGCPNLRLYRLRQANGLS